MRLLLDTHVLLWWLDDPTRLSDEARIAIANPRSIVLLSSICLLEIALKERTGKLKLADGLEAIIEQSRFTELPFTLAHAAALRLLPSYHRDPFDRALIAQAHSEDVTLLTRDAAFTHYDITLLAA